MLGRRAPTIRQFTPLGWRHDGLLTMPGRFSSVCNKTRQLIGCKILFLKQSCRLLGDLVVSIQSRSQHGQGSSAMQHDTSFSGLSGLIAVGLLASLAMTTALHGQTATDDLTVTAGLSRGLSVTCGSMSMGVVRLPAGPRGGEVLIDYDDSTNEIGLFGDGAVNASLIEEPSSGECTITGMPNKCFRVSAVNGNAFSGNFQLISGAPLSSNPAHGLPAAERTAEFGSFLLEVNTVETRVRNGDDTITTALSALKTNDDGKYILVVRGAFEIPDDLTRADFGGYSTNISLTFDTSDLCL